MPEYDAKLLLTTEPKRRWTLADIADEIGVTPVYLTDAFRRGEGVPLYRYHLRVRLALALNQLADCDDLTALAIELGFASHSHFSASFKRAYGLTPSEFRESIAAGSTRSEAKDFDSVAGGGLPKLVR